MKIEHIAMYVNDLEAARDFLQIIWAGSPMMDIIIRQRTFALILYALMAAQDWR